MVQVKISETYDLSTSTDKMGIIGVHTPNLFSVQRVWGHLIQSHQKMRFVSCDVAIACASMLPADPLQIGTEAGSIAPQDMFNPILYTAVSNDSYNTLQNRIYALNPVENVAGQDMGSLVRGDVESNAFNIYYSLLADPDKWKKAMPQAGLSMKGLYPICYQLLSTYGQTVSPMTAETVGQEELDSVGASDSTGNGTIISGKAYTIRGPAVRMPAFPTAVVVRNDNEEPTSDTFDVSYPEVPPTYVACIITPPAKLHKLYYRMKVTWTIEFTGLRSTLDTYNFSRLSQVGTEFYGTDYAEQSSKMDTTTSSVDVKDADIELVMTSTR